MCYNLLINIRAHFQVLYGQHKLIVLVVKHFDSNRDTLKAFPPIYFETISLCVSLSLDCWRRTLVIAMMNGGWHASEVGTGHRQVVRVEQETLLMIQ